MRERIYFESELIPYFTISYKGELINASVFLAKWKSGKIDLSDIKIKLCTGSETLVQEGFEPRGDYYEYEIEDLKDYIVIVNGNELVLHRANVVAQIDGCKIITDGVHSAVIRLNNMSEFIYKEIPAEVVQSKESEHLGVGFLKSCLVC